MDSSKGFVAANMARLQEYLQTRAAVPRIGEAEKVHYPFITISREAGAGGHSLAQAILNQMEKESHPVFQGWHMLDQEICEEVVADPKMKTSLGELLCERFVREWDDYLSQIIVGTSSQMSIYKKIFQFIQTMCSVGKVIAVGRGANFVTRPLPLGIHVRLVAEREDRVRHMMREKSLSRDKAEAEVKRLDQNRELLAKTYFERDVRNPLEYDIVLNMSHVPLDFAASTVVDLVKKRFENALPALRANV